MHKPRLLVVSGVLPFPRNAGQNQRVYYKLKALREDFHITFLTFAPEKDILETEKNLALFCDTPIVLRSIYAKNILTKGFHKIIGVFFRLRTGLKFSNYLIGDLEFTEARLAEVLQNREFDLVLFEYWHAYRSANALKDLNIPSALDMHDILWQSYTRQLDLQPYLPAWWRHRAIEKYKAAEEYAWSAFDILIAINQAEYEYARSILNGRSELLCVPMGTDLKKWPYSWSPSVTPRIAYYGGLGSPHNQKDAVSCYREIMPEIWKRFPEAEFWIVGSNPPDFIRALTKDPRVTVTGFVESVQDVLAHVSYVLCPWSGTYGFRSRLVEVMALGVPVIASPDAVYGMGMEEARGIFLEETMGGMIEKGLAFLSNHELLREQSLLARIQMEEKFSFEQTYLSLSKSLVSMIGEAGAGRN